MLSYGRGLEETMERLTERFDGWVMRKGCHGPCRTCDGLRCADVYPLIDRLADYEDTDLMPDDVTDLMAAHGTAIAALAEYRALGTVKELRALISRLDTPLTLEELMGMDGDPVWVCDLGGSYGTWALVDVENEVCRRKKSGFAMFDVYNKVWLAYRCKPEEDYK